jgi:hypothetical protein
MPDADLLAKIVEGGFVFVTNNEADFVTLSERAEIHGGLVVLPQRLREDQFRLFHEALSHIETRAKAAGEAPSDWMLNRVVEVDEETEAVADHALPGP